MVAVASDHLGDLDFTVIIIGWIVAGDCFGDILDIFSDFGKLVIQRFGQKMICVCFVV